MWGLDESFRVIHDLHMEIEDIVPAFSRNKKLIKIPEAGKAPLNEGLTMRDKI